MPEPAPKVSVNANMSAKRGHNKMISCKVYSTAPNYTVTWFKIGATLDLRFDPDVTIFRNGTLLIRYHKMYILHDYFISSNLFAISEMHCNCYYLWFLLQRQV